MMFRTKTVEICVSCRKPSSEATCSAKCAKWAWIHRIVGLAIPPFPGTRYSGVRTRKTGRRCQARVKGYSKNGIHRCSNRAVSKNADGSRACPYHTDAFRDARRVGQKKRARP